MTINMSLQENAILKELATRMKQYRIDSQITQEEYADKSMVSVSTIRRFENGGEISLTNMIKLLKALGLESNLNLLIPDPDKRPTHHIQNVKTPQRVRKHSKRNNTDNNEWQWGEDK